MKIQYAESTAVADKVRYASTLVILGVNPDDLDGYVADHIKLPYNHEICFAIQARALRELADALDARHREEPCS